MKVDSQTRLAVVAAVLVGLFAVIAVNKYIATKTRVAPVPQATILVSSSEIREGSEVGDEMLTVATIPFEALSNIHIALPSKTDPGFQKAYDEAKAKIVGRRVKRIVSAGTPIFWIDIETEPKIPFADLIGENNRAVTMPVDSISSVSGFIRPGSRVDVALTATEDKLGLLNGTKTGAAGEKAKVVTSVILQNVPVIAVGRSYDLQEESQGYGSITLNLPVKAALLMIQARSMGQVTYLLRNVRDTATERDRNALTVAPGASFNEVVHSL